MQSKDEIELAVRKAFREVLIEVLSFGFGVVELVLVRWFAVLLVDGFSLIHTVIYDQPETLPRLFYYSVGHAIKK